MQRDVEPALLAGSAVSRHVEPAGRIHSVPGGGEFGLIEPDQASAQGAVVARIERAVDPLQGRTRAIEMAVADVRRGRDVAGVVAAAVEVGREGVDRGAGVVVLHVCGGNELSGADIQLVDLVRHVRSNRRVVGTGKQVDPLVRDVADVVDPIAAPAFHVRDRLRNARCCVVHAGRVVVVAGAIVGAAGEDAHALEDRREAHAQLQREEAARGQARYRDPGTIHVVGSQSGGRLRPGRDSAAHQRKRQVQGARTRSRNIGRHGLLPSHSGRRVPSTARRQAFREDSSLPRMRARRRDRPRSIGRAHQGRQASSRPRRRTSLLRTSCEASRGERRAPQLTACIFDAAAPITGDPIRVVRHGQLLDFAVEAGSTSTTRGLLRAFDSIHVAPSGTIPSVP